MAIEEKEGTTPVYNLTATTRKVLVRGQEFSFDPYAAVMVPSVKVPHLLRLYPKWFGLTNPLVTGAAITASAPQIEVIKQLPRAGLMGVIAFLSAEINAKNERLKHEELQAMALALATGQKSGPNVLPPNPTVTDQTDPGHTHNLSATVAA